MAVYPNPSVSPPPVNLQYYEQSGRPVIGDPANVPWSEFAQSARTVARGCYGTFDTAHLEQRHFGRTYREVLTYAATQEFVIWTPPMYRWVTCEKYGVRPVVFVQWTELASATRTTVNEDINKQRFRQGRPQ